jgi:hypothetical protein
MHPDDLIKGENCKNCGNPWWLPVEDGYKCSMCKYTYKTVIGVDLANGKDFGAAVSGRVDSDGQLTIDSVSIVPHCPYCGSDDWDTPRVMPNGITCKHPTKLRRVR